MKKSKIVSLVLTFAMLASMAVPAMAAEAEIMPISAPVTEGHWSDAAMGRWAGVGVFKGDQYGDFMPDKEMTRAEFAQVLVNLMGYTAVAENTYADIPADAWYADAMLKLVAAGVMQGTGYNDDGREEEQGPEGRGGEEALGDPQPEQVGLYRPFHQRKGP